MNDADNLFEPEAITAIDSDTRASGFEMASEPLTCTFLRTLAASKPGGKFLELGSGTGLSTAWILDGMDANSHLTTIDNNPALLSILEKHLGDDPRLKVICGDGDEFIKSLNNQTFDFIFADTWPGKYRLLYETLALVKPSGFYIIDDMTFREDWPAGHAEKAINLISILEQRDDFQITKMSWASGLIMATKI